MELKLPEIKLIPVEKLKRDPSNPNYMNEEQMDGLRTSMKRWGYLDPVIIDQHHMIADGEHRLDIFMEFGRELIPCYIIRCKTDVERRLIRQTMNKLHGRHRSEYDVQELKILFDSDKLDELTVLIAGNKDQYLTLLEQNELIPRTLTEKPLTTGENPKI